MAGKWVAGAMLALLAATLAAVIIGFWLVRGDIDRLPPPADPPEVKKGTFCCKTISGRSGTGCVEISGDAESKARCKAYGGGKVVDCAGTHTEDGDTVTCY
ncbi:MAG TPA: hypothetical protein VML75_26250 [Kofleriaceae bacterium]|nr:hypothetical protein [Kofleriaceae bacterium]